MRMAEAMAIINKEEPSGFMVSFEEVVGDLFLESNCFPEKDAGEPLISTEEEAWELAKKFAAKTKGRYFNIYVVDSKYRPVCGYKENMIVNR